VWLPEFDSNPPDPARNRPVIVHSPSAPNAKGTPAVLAAIEGLRDRFDFDFQLIQGMPRRQALEMVRDADIFLDQFVLGSYGMAALEAMALGKPVLCYIKPSLATQYPSDLPIVNATQESLTDVLARLLADGAQRHEIGLCSRAYVERYHDAIKIASELKGIYGDLLRRHSMQGD
jgi:glycosyltransferase involved in cell wall biosynthesis